MKVLNSFLRSPMVAAAFLMATSAIGPGFLTQTAFFTAQLGAAFGFVILVSVILDIGAQLNIWRILTVTGKRAQEIAALVFPGAGYILTALIVLGGLAFNTGNLAGAGLGINVLTGLSVKAGAALSALIALVIFLSRNALAGMDNFAKFLGLIMIGLTFYVVLVSAPPADAVIQGMVFPATTDISAIITLVGGTVGGYITFAGGHRLLDAGVKGPDSIPKVNRSAVNAILLASLMRILLFLAAFGVVANGLIIDDSNPAASVFRLAAGEAGYRIFGVVMWCASITSVAGSAYTSVSFLKTFHPRLNNSGNQLIILFILLSAVIFLIIGQPVKVLVAAGTLNGFILPLALMIMLAGIYRKKISGDYRHPLLFTLVGIAVIIATLWMSIKTISNYF